MKWLRNLIDTFLAPVQDFRVIGWTVIVGILAYFVDPQGLKMVGVVLHVVFFWFFGLCIRKAFFPYRTPPDENGKTEQLKLSLFFREALQGNHAAAIVVFSQILMMCCIALSFVLWVR
jgi:hypothetical protein